MRAIGIVGWSGAGKTTLITRLIPELNRRLQPQSDLNRRLGEPFEFCRIDRRGEVALMRGHGNSA